MLDYKLVIFDCDGVLVDSEMISAQIIADVIRPLGIEMTAQEAFKEFVGGSMAQSIAYIENLIGGPASIDIEKEYRERTYAAYRQQMKPVQGVVDILNRLRIEKCVASNGPQSKIRLNLQVTRLDRYFIQQRIFSAYDIEKWKPEPDLYLNAAQKIGVHPSECIVIEDSVNGLRAAQAAGMLCLGNTSEFKPLPDDIEGTEVYEDMHQIGRRLDSLGLLKNN